MSDLVDKLLPAKVKSLRPYESARRLFASTDGEQQQVWLNANESPFANQYDLDDSRFNRYPDCQPTKVLKRYADYAGVKAENTLVSRGADEGIELLIRTFCVPGQDRILICPPTYGMYAISAETCNVAVERAPLRTDFSLDVEAICSFKDSVKLVFICSPNNPTGTGVDPAQLTKVLDHFADSALVVVDEAYIEFDWHNSRAKLLNDYPNLVILRTLSKAFALAGIRCGFTLAQPAVIQALLKVIAPYPIAEPVAQIAAAALTHNGIGNMQQQLTIIGQQKQQLSEFLAAFDDIELVGNDKANFLLFRTPHKAQLMAYLIAQGILIRDQSKQLNLDNCLRVTIGTEQQNQLLMTFISRFFNSKESV